MTAVLHQLAFGAEVFDAVTRSQVSLRVEGTREASALIPFETAGTARFKLRHGPRVPELITLRLDDPRRCLVPRRFTIPLWGTAEVPVLSRVLRPWLLPGSAYPLSRGITTIRGRVVRDGAPVRWPRIQALGTREFPLGWAHGDDRGEFLLLINTTGELPWPPPDTLDVDLVVSAPDPAHAPLVDEDDRLADLVVEQVARSSAPPLPGELDNDLLRGRVLPAGYLTSSAPRPGLTVTIGEEFAVPDDVVFVL